MKVCRLKSFIVNIYNFILDTLFNFESVKRFENRNDARYLKSFGKELKLQI